MKLLIAILLSAASLACGRHDTGKQPDTPTDSMVQATTGVPPRSADTASPRADTVVATRDSLASPDRYRRDTLHPHASDESINGMIWLFDGNSVEAMFGNVRPYMREGPHPDEIIFGNRTKKEYLQMSAAYGSGPNDMMWFTVGRVADMDSVPQIFSSKVPSFQTEHGVRLGMSIDSLIAVRRHPGKRQSVRALFRERDIAGYDYKEYGNEATEVLTYRDTSLSDRYRAEYFFDRKRRLIKYAFGYENP
jgi:hypothetical protein